MHELGTLIPADGWSRFAFDAAWQSTLLGLSVWLVLRALHGRAAARAWLALLAVGILLAVPALSAAVRWSGVGLLAGSVNAADAPAAAEVSGMPMPMPPVVVNDVNRPQRTASIADDMAAGGERAGLQPVSVVANAKATPAQPIERQPIGNSISPCRILGWAWAIASVAVAMRLLASLFELRRLLRETRPCDDPQILALCRQAAARLGLSRLPRVEISGRITLPALAGLGKARLLIPAKMLEHPSPDWFNVFCHELAHLRRGDTWGRLLVELVRTGLPWQPLVWILGREYLRACEEAADDWVVWTGTDPLDLAATLTNWAAASPPRLATAVAGMSEPKWRIVRLAGLSEPSNPRLRATQRWGSMIAVIIVASLLTLFQTPRGQLAADEPNHATTRQASAGPPNSGPSQTAAKAKASPDESARVDLYGDPLPDEALVRMGTIRLRQRSFVTCMAISPDGKIIAAANPNVDVGISLWEADTGRLIRHMKDPDAPGLFTHGVAFSPDGSKLASVRDSGPSVGNVLVWDVSSGRILLNKKQKYVSMVVAFSPDGARLAAGGDGKVGLYDAVRGTELRVFESGAKPKAEQMAYGAGRSDQIATRAIAFSPDGTLLAAGVNGAEPMIGVWNVQTHEMVAEIQKPHAASLESLSFTPDGKQLLSGGYHTYRRELKGDVVAEMVDVPEIRFWDVSTGKLARALAHEKSARGNARAVLSADGKVLASGIRDAILIWDVATGKPLRQIATPGWWGMLQLVMSADGKRVATCEENAIRVWDVATGKPLLSNLAAACGRPRVVAYAPDGTIVISAAGGRVTAWDTKSGKALWQHALSNPGATGVAISAGGELVAAAGEMPWPNLELGGGLRLWKTRTGEHVRDFGEPGRFFQSQTVAFSPDGKLLVGPGHENGVTIWEIATGRKRFDVQLHGEMPYNAAIAFTPDSKSLYVATHSFAGVFAIDPATGKAEKRFKAFQSVKDDRMAGINSAVFTPDAKWLITCQADRLVVWNVATGKATQTVMSTERDFRQGLSLSPDGRLLAGIDESLGNESAGKKITFYVVDRASGRIRLWGPDPGWTDDALQCGDGFPISAAISSDNKRLVSGMDRGTLLIWNLDAIFGR